MNATDPASARPTRLLLATDLSPRSDRALDRAVQLAREWQAGLLVVTVMETSARPDPLAVPVWPPFPDEATREHRVRQQLARDAGNLAVPADLRVLRGDAAPAIADAAAAEACGLILTGVARNEPFGRIFVGSTVEQLARIATMPVLVVRQRPRGRYRRVLVATDFSEPSRHALLRALALFPDRRIVLYHAHALPNDITSTQARIRASRQVAAGEAAAFLDATGLDAATRQRIRVVVEPEAPEIGLSRYVMDHDIELVVHGTHGRTGLMQVLIGSVATQLLRWTPCDTLLVRQPRA
jgi:nucleotide-binding universal stress UspA family protein